MMKSPSSLSSFPKCGSVSTLFLRFLRKSSKDSSLSKSTARLTSSSFGLASCASIFGANNLAASIALASSAILSK